VPNLPGAERFELGRMAVLSSTTPSDFERLCRGRLSGREKMRGAVLGMAKSVLGNGTYQKMRGAALEKTVPSAPKS
jgi:hypothetical protein